MAIFGVGSTWSAEEIKDEFFEKNRFILGWDAKNAKDLYSLMASLKVGDILYIKSCSPRYIRSIKVKGIGIVNKNLLTCISSGELEATSIKNWSSLFLGVSWVYQNQFLIDVPKLEGKLTNVRPATLYEEYLPFVQEIIINKLIGSICNSIREKNNYA